MNLKNSLSITTSRFSILYRAFFVLFIFYTTLVALVSGILSNNLGALISDLTSQTYLTKLGDFLKAAILGTEKSYLRIAENFSRDFNLISSLLVRYKTDLYASLGIIIVFGLISVVFYSCLTYLIGVVYHRLMTTGGKFKLLNVMPDNILNAFKYTLVSLFVKIPLILLSFIISWGILRITMSLTWVFGIIAGIWSFVLLNAFFETLTTLWFATIMNSEGKPKIVECLFKSLKTTFANFRNLIGHNIILNLLMFSFIIVFSVSTLFLGLGIGILMCVAYKKVFGMVMYNRIKEIKYYVNTKDIEDSKTIIKEI